ncbi:MAG: class I SAM-dependent methyltransferase [Pseudomonadaceae bacterium]|nr:class I SAM-dependent methyltransferase [Pseudomonadaceae bacterium]
MNVTQHNRDAWNRQALSGECRWSQPVESEAIERARAGHPEIILTPIRQVPLRWFGELSGCDLLGLASGGGQQMPLLAAAGARVVSFDNSEEQLALDALVAKREGLKIATERGDMANLSVFADASFDVIVHPVANVFAANLAPVWQECARVLRPGGRLLSGFMNPDFYLFDHEAIEDGAPLEVRFPLPFADSKNLPADELARRVERGEPLEFSHSLEEQIGGQLAAGFSIAGFYEDRWDDEASPLNRFMPTSMATLAIRSA